MNVHITAAESIRGTEYRGIIEIGARRFAWLLKFRTSIGKLIAEAEDHPQLLGGGGQFLFPIVLTDEKAEIVPLSLEEHQFLLQFLADLAIVLHGFPQARALTDGEGYLVEALHLHRESAQITMMVENTISVDDERVPKKFRDPSR